MPSSRFAFAAVLLMSLGAGCARSPQAKEAEYLAAGKKLLARKDYARAVLNFRNAVRMAPNDPEPYYQLALACLGSGDLPTAVAGFRKTLELNPKHTGAELKLAQLMAVTNDPALLKEAEARLKSLASGSPADEETLHALALTELKLGSVEEAAQNLEQVLAHSPAALHTAAALAQLKLANKDAKGAEEILRKACQSAPKSAEPHVVLGSFYVAQNRTPEAAAEFQQALRMNPRSGPALFELAKLERATGRKETAEQSFRRLAAMDDRTYRPAYGLFLFEEGRRDEAVRELERLAKTDPDDRVARTRLVLAYRVLGRPSDAQKVLDGALARNSKDLEALLQRAELSLAMNQLVQAETDLNEVLHLKPASADAHYIRAKLHQVRKESLSYRQELAEALRLNRFLAGVRVELAGVLLAEHDGRGALDVLSGAPDSQKRLIPLIVARNWALWSLGDLDAMRKGIDEGLARARTADLVAQDGVWKLRAGNFTGARAALEEALKINPADLLALRALPRTYRDARVALEAVKTYAARQPRSAPVQQFLGTLLLANGEREEARRAFEAARAADARAIQPDLALAQLDAAESRWDHVATRLNTVLAANPANATARVWLGNVEEIRGNHDAALEAFRRAVETDPNNAQALNNLAYGLVEYGNRPNDALKYAEKAQELAPENAEYADTVGWILYKKGLYPLALKHLERAVSGRPSTVVAEYHLAMAYAKAGDPKRARVVLASALRKNPGVAEARAAQDLLSQFK